MIYEIRNYHFRPDLIDAYKAWAKAEAIPHLVSQLDVVGFWINSKDTPEVNGAPLDHLGTANVTGSFAGGISPNATKCCPALCRAPRGRTFMRASLAGGPAICGVR